MLKHYARGFAAAGQRQEVVSATREVAQHRYVKGNDLIEFRLVK